MKNRKIPFIAILSWIFLWGCYPNGPETAEEMDVVVTKHNPDYDFVSKTTYAIPDRIVKITGNISEGEDPVFIPDETAAQIISVIEQNMTSLGWQRVDLEANPDLILTPATLEVTTISYYYDYWYWWYGGYPGYGWGYYPPVYVSSYSSGTLMMNLIDKNELGANGNPILQWSALINGVMTETYESARVTSLIDQAFSQSTYLKTN